MRHASVRALFVLLSSLAGLAACHDATSPIQSDREYTLRSYYGEPLPVTLHATADGDTAQLLGELVALTPDGRSTRTFIYRNVVAGGEATLSRSDLPYTYRIELGRRITLRHECSFDLCLLQESGTISEQQLVLFDESAPESTKVYDRATIVIDDVAR